MKSNAQNPICYYQMRTEYIFNLLWKKKTFVKIKMNPFKIKKKMWRISPLLYAIIKKAFTKFNFNAPDFGYIVWNHTHTKSIQLYLLFIVKFCLSVHFCFLLWLPFAWSFVKQIVHTNHPFQSSIYPKKKKSTSHSKGFRCYPIEKIFQYVKTNVPLRWKIRLHRHSSTEKWNFIFAKRSK